MLGSIIGDIVGSIYEFNNVKTKDFPFFPEQGDFTDDSILTVATAEWLLESGGAKDSGPYYFRYASRYPHPMGAYGNSFSCWIQRAGKGDFTPYNSCGNGSAMRVGPVGWAFPTIGEVLAAAEASAACTHNHPEGIKGAQATALCIFLARIGATKEEIRMAVMFRFGYDLRFTCSEIRDTYGWGATCQDTVPQAIVAFLDGEDFEDCVRNAISLGGDSDTLGCITGSIAEAYFGIPENIYRKGMEYLPSSFRHVVKEFEQKYGNKIIKEEQYMYDRMYTPDRISSLKKHEVFVFGSNLAGMHAGGAARLAADRFGAVCGQGVGLQGQSYAIPTMQGGIETIRPYVDEFIRFAAAHPELTFYVTRIGCGIAGFTVKEIAPLFAKAVDVANIILPEDFVKVILA